MKGRDSNLWHNVAVHAKPSLSVTNDISFHARVGRFSPFFVFEECGPLIPMECGHSSDFVLALTLTLTLMIQDSGPSNHRTMFRFSKLKLIGFGGMGMVPIRSFVTKTGIGLGGAKQIVNVTI